MSPDAAAAAAALCGVAGLAAAPLLRRLPEPEPDPRYAHEGPKQPYVEMAAEPGVRVGIPVVSALAGAVVGLDLGWDWALLLVLPLVPVGVLLSLVDRRTRLLPSRIVLPATVLALLLVLACWLAEGDTDALVRAGIGLVAARSAFWLLWWIRSSGLGFGDVRLAALLGVVLGYLGWGQLLVGLYAGFLLFGVPGLVLAVVRRDRALLRAAYPFGPFLLLGALVGIVLGDEVWARLVTG